ncbi:pirin family protein [uncultured Draconibacterium sp.]|uniref:pirin family protein n=1 Tax=uncultured Draconibacterium sp. TaxID=1573823 RepID=UPI0025DAE9DF|nr:pirin family protein [uncultured Draconibacterium sp.]
MKTVLYRADSRGYANHGWLEARHTFSFANYFNRERMNFGVLRVLNDDKIDGGQGFGMHPHDNMEIITIPLEGDLEHKDNMGNEAVIREGDVQVMSAGTGVYHSEYNHNPDKALKLFQIWLFPNKQNVQPRYDQISIRDVAIPNRLYQILSPNPDDQGVWIHQDAWFYLGNFEAGKTDSYTLKREVNGLFVMVIDGQVTISGNKLSARDALGIWEMNKIEVEATSDARILLMDLPMQVK